MAKKNKQIVVTPTVIEGIKTLLFNSSFDIEPALNVEEFRDYCDCMATAVAYWDKVLTQIKTKKNE